MKLLVVSDSHGSLHQLECICRANPDADGLIFCGDGYEDVELLGYLCPGIVYAAVAGNCDRGSDAAGELFFEVEGVKLFVTHGHGYEVKRWLYPLAGRARELGADAALFGHTHQPLIQWEEDGLLLANPGSCREVPRYLVLELEDGKLLAVSHGVAEPSPQ